MPEKNSAGKTARFAGRFASQLKFCAPLAGLALLIATYNTASTAAKPTPSPLPGNKTGTERGELIGPAFDCDGDGRRDDARIDFDNDGLPDDCVLEREEIPEPPFQQLESVSSETFYSLIPEVGWDTRYQCGDGLYEVNLRRPEDDRIEYSADGLTLSSPVVYDDIDPNLNHPLIVKDPTDGIRYAFSQERDGEFYEYAIADYSGDIGLYVYQTGEQIIAAPCEPASSSGS